MTTITARVSEKLNEDLERLAAFQDRTKSNVIKRVFRKSKRIIQENNKQYKTLLIIHTGVT